MLALDQTQTVPVTLADNAPPDAPAFIYRYRTIRQRARAIELQNAAATEADEEKCKDLLVRCLSVALVGFRNVINPDTDEPLNFERLVTDEAGEKVVRVPAVLSALIGMEAWRLANRVNESQHLSAKNFYSSASSQTAGAEPSVETVTAESAPTPPPQPTP